MQTILQLSRYAVVGLSANFFLFSVYLFLTYLGVGHKTAMTFLYGVGMLLTFIFNKRWSFRHQGPIAPAICRYFITYSMGYVINIFMLWYFVDQLEFPHRWIQGVAVFVVAGVIFLMQKYWIFSMTHVKSRVAR